MKMTWETTSGSKKWCIFAITFRKNLFNSSTKVKIYDLH